MKDNIEYEIILVQDHVREFMGVKLKNWHYG